MASSVRQFRGRGSDLLSPMITVVVRLLTMPNKRPSFHRMVPVVALRVGTFPCGTQVLAPPISLGCIST